MFCQIRFRFVLGLQVKPEIEALNKTIIQAPKASLESKREAIEQMWDKKIKAMLFPDIAEYIEKFPAREQLEVKEEKCNLYFDDAMSSSFGFKDYPSVDETFVDLVDVTGFLGGGIA